MAWAGPIKGDAAVPSVHLFLSFLNPRDHERKLGPQCTRDVLAAHHIAAALQSEGYRLGGALFNYPPADWGSQEVMRVDTSGLAPGDVLVTATRPSKDRAERNWRKQVRPGRTDLEERIHRVWDRYLAILARGHAKLQPWLFDRVAQGFEDRRDVYFREKQGATYKMLHTGEEGARRRDYRGEPRTAAFLVREPELWPAGPAYVGLAAMDSACALAWSYLLQHRYTELLRREGFTMVDLLTAPIPDRTPDMRWALEWKAEVIVHAPHGAGPGLEA